ncbi:unnamed protein product [Protopolystoma xenopodis]|uniref:RSE1/DDB1/CPSF1 first beta-propeller domain-containing protein n=1 Tax=Protopolystoma xenopodis TaxID=117903 RepID=A0A3S5CQH6_9PLAT|nr:unnamed protein product [Protopolystoma xenopodis]
MAQSVPLFDSSKPTSHSALFQHFSSPTVVDKCIYCSFIHPSQEDLILVRSNHIEIYNFIIENNEWRLNKVFGTSLYEEIEDIVSVRFYGETVDSILVSFKDAKLAVMNFDPVQYELRTLSIHNFEHENQKGGRFQFNKSPLLRVDPNQRCAVMLIYDRHIAVIPFRRADILGAVGAINDSLTPNTGPMFSDNDNPTHESAWQRKLTAPILQSYTTCLATSTGEKINNIIDFDFLNGFYEPTLLVLYESIGTWAGRVSARRDTCCIVALSFNLQARTNPVIWFQEGLPYDCSKVVPAPRSVGMPYFT